MKQIEKWDPEDSGFWESQGSAVAKRNLWISIPCLLCGFSVWMYWSIIIVQMQNLGFAFTKDQLYTLPAIAGLAGATLRIPNSFLIAIAGGRNSVAVTTALLLLPSLGVGAALGNRETGFAVFAVLAALSGFGGGAFASSMSNISFFFPKKMQGAALGLNAGLGNLGVSVMQVLLPLAMTIPLFGPLGGAGMALPAAMGGAQRWIQNCGLVWVVPLAVLAIVAWFRMDNLPMHKVDAAPVAVSKILWLNILGLACSAVGIYLLIGLKWKLNDLLKIFIVLPLVICLMIALMRYATPGSMRGGLNKQFSIFGLKHTWIMTWLYTMTFGSFIGYSAAFPKLIQDVFGTLPGGALNPHAPNPLAYAWLGPLVGSLVRPVGGWISDKLGGARVTHWSTVIMIGAALGVAYFIKAAGAAPRPETFWLPFLGLFLLLFITTGIGNGSTFRMIPVIFKPEQAGPILGWTSAVAAFGAYIIPKVIGVQIQKGAVEYALYGFAIYYVSCLAVNWWYYTRPGAEIKC